jgi:hypothetical protein
LRKKLQHNFLHIISAEVSSLATHNNVPAVANIKQRHAAHSTSSNSQRDGDDTSDSTGPASQLAHNEVVDLWHCRLGHAGRDRVRELMRNCELLTIPDSPI